eukprot:scaffold480652_cov15-Prasinocladus_malaysianus.AAC.1
MSAYPVPVPYSVSELRTVHNVHDVQLRVSASTTTVRKPSHRIQPGGSSSLISYPYFTKSVAT